MIATTPNDISLSEESKSLTLSLDNLAVHAVNIVDNGKRSERLITRSMTSKSISLLTLEQKLQCNLWCFAY